MWVAHQLRGIGSSASYNDIKGNCIMGLGALQPGHLIVILVIVLLIFGPGKLPELGKAMGDGLRELKKATGGDEHKDAATTPASTTASAVAPPPAPAPMASTPVTPIGAAPTMANGGDRS